MACRGVHFALTTEDEAALLAASGDDEVMEIEERIEERWDRPWLSESDKAWDALHRCLGDGSLSPDGGGGAPLARCVLGGRWLHDGDEYIVSYLTAAEVKALVAPLDAVDERWFGERYATLATSDYDGPHDDDDRAYTWEGFQSMRELFRKASAAGRAIVFTVDQ